MGKFSELSYDSQIGMIDVNVRALTGITHISLKYMKKGSKIINMASAAAFMPQPYFAVYSATKSYVLSFSRAMKRELRPRGIKVLTVCPGPVETEFFEVASTTGEPKLYKKIMTEKSETVVINAFKDLREDKDLSVSGYKMKIFRIIAKILPHSFIMKFIKG
jgi:short-subunit dehydrogenase